MKLGVDDRNKCRVVYVKFHLNRCRFVVAVAKCLGGSLFWDTVYIGLIECKSYIYLETKSLFMNDNDRLYCKLHCNVICLGSSYSSPVASRVKIRNYVWRQEVASFGQTATDFGK